MYLTKSNHIFPHNAGKTMASFRPDAAIELPQYHAVPDGDIESIYKVWQEREQVQHELIAAVCFTRKVVVPKGACDFTFSKLADGVLSIEHHTPKSFELRSLGMSLIKFDTTCHFPCPLPLWLTCPPTLSYGSPLEQDITVSITYVLFKPLLKRELCDQVLMWIPYVFDVTSGIMGSRWSLT
jgi:hypothetical protein